MIIERGRVEMLRAGKLPYLFPPAREQRGMLLPNERGQPVQIINTHIVQRHSNSGEAPGGYAIIARIRVGSILVALLSTLLLLFLLESGEGSSALLDR